jgi:hypothetical protein
MWQTESMAKEIVENKNPDEPIKRSEFESTMIALANDLHFIRETMVTKEDAKQFATKEDLKGFATKEDLRQLKDEMTLFATKKDLERFATKEDLQQFKADINHEFQAAVEIITDEMRGAHKDEIAELQDGSSRHEERITALEQRAGLR